ncbi:MAG: hypothetical protein QOJ07_3636 [Thermoleophilaceae bacterium]|nr:hypothetical protein [Thermoleophilaceae bacterium]
MRWDELKIANDDGTTLPGYRDPARVRTFDAPEALDTRFYEVRARSALNRVPKASRMPFAWTINPYRGCTHACTYCLAGETPILMADGSHRALADLRDGEAIVGTEGRGRHRRLTTTEVRDHWSTIKPAYRVTLADGTELVTSADHRFLSSRGWKHVMGAENGRERRPHLTNGSRLMGTGRFARQPEHDLDYQRGYLCGLVRADLRLELSDREALDRAQGFLQTVGAATREFAFGKVAAGYRPAVAIRTFARGNAERIDELIRWPLSPTDGWRKGFLAGIFDAEGSCGEQALRISSTDPAIVGWTHSCLEHFGFSAVVERTRNANGLKNVRLRGGLREQLRFFHATDPATRRALLLDGRAIKDDSDTRVTAIEPLGIAMRLYDITTGTGDFIADGVVSHNCFARPTHTYLDMNAGRDFEKEIIVKVNAPELVRRELARPSWKGEHVAMGTNTDPYQWVEGRYKLMPGIWEAMRDAANPCSILTKSPLVLRDLPLLVEVARRTTVSANFSVPTLNEGAWRETEPHTPSPRARLEAVAELNRAGIPCGILIAPLMPGINDDPKEVERIIELATEAGAVSIGGIALHLRGEVREIFFDWLRAKRPDLVPEYERMYRRGAYAPPDVRDRLASLAGSHKLPPRRFLRDVEPAVADARASPPRRKPEVQTSLF